MAQFEREMLAGNPGVEHWSTYVGRGAPRFVLSFDVQPADVSFGQTIIVTKGLDVRDKLKQQMEAYLQKTFPGTDAYVKLLDIGPPVGKPIQYRVSGEDLQTVRDLAQKLGSIVGTYPSLRNLAFDWNEPARVVKIDVLQDKARQLGVSSQDIAMALNTVVQGNAVTQVRDDIYLVDVIGRAAEKERGSIDTLLDLQLQSSSGQSVPLSSVATFRYELEQPTIWRRDRVPTITIKAGIGDATQPATVVKALSDKVAAFEKTLPVGYSVKVGGAVEESAKSQGPIAKVAPAMFVIMATLLMIQLQSFHRLFLVFSVAPLALIGVVVALLASNSPARLRRAPGRARAGRNPHPQLRDPDRADRGTACRGNVGMEGGGGGDRTPHAADHAHRRGRDAGADPDLARDILGSHGLRDDGRDRRRHGADASLPAGALRRLVPDSS